jgi:hypothetical protein
MVNRLQSSDYTELAATRGFLWLGPPVPSGTTPTQWQCRNVHVWSATYSKIKQGRDCPICANQSRKDKQRHNPAKYRALAEHRGFRWLGPEAANANQLTQWVCSQKHSWQASYNTILQGHGCPECATQAGSEKRRNTPTDYHTLAKERNFRWLGPTVSNNSTPTGWECPEKHTWQASYGKIQQRRGCPQCAKVSSGEKQRLSADDYDNLAKSRNFTWLGPFVDSNSTPTMWECPDEHRWQATYGGIQQGRGCPECGNRARGQKRRFGAEYYTALATERGFCWLGPEVPNSNTPTTWECQKKHNWRATYSKINQGQGCPNCAKKATGVKQRLLPEAYKELAASRKFSWLGPEVPNSNTQTGWECAEKHNWQARYSSIVHGSGCPKCARAKSNNTARQSTDDYEELALARGFRWLGPAVQNTKTPTEWACPKNHKWSATYHSVQHGLLCPECKPHSPHGHSPLTPTDYERLAAERNYTFSGLGASDGNAVIEWTCAKNHKWRANYITIEQGRGCPQCAKQAATEKRRHSSADYKALAEKNGFQWLGSVVPNSKTPTEWACGNGHTWKATYGNISQGKGCPDCAKKSRAEKRRLQPTDYESLAVARGFRWNGPVVRNNSIPTQWTCKNEHSWEAGYSSIQQGSGCPECAKETISENRRLESNAYIALAHDQGFDWLGPAVQNARVPTMWQCSKKHIWESTYNNLQQGATCPECARLSAAARLRLQPADYAKLAQDRAFQWLGPASPTNNTPTRWACALGHEWDAGYGSIQQGAGCPECAKVSSSEKQRLPPSEYKKRAKKSRILWLGPEVPNSNTPTKWQCPKSSDHQWMASYSSIKQGSGCPFCIVWIGELTLLQRVRELLPTEEVLHRVHRSVLPWLARQELDIFVPSRMLGLEYQGEQHYKAIDYFGGEETLRQIMARDQRKRELCKDNCVRLIEIRYDDRLTDEQLLGILNGPAAQSVS